MKFSAALFFFLFILCIRAQRLPNDLLQSISPHLKTGTLAQLPLVFQAKDELRNRLVRFLDERYFEGPPIGRGSIFRDPFVISTLNKIYDLLSTKFGVDGASRQRTLDPFSMSKLNPNEQKERKRSFYFEMIKQVNLGSLRPIFALFWIEDVDVADMVLTDLLPMSKMRIPYEEGISDEKWSKRINEKLPGFFLAEKQKLNLVNQKNSLFIDLFELWVMKNRKFPIENKKIISELKINGEDYTAASIVNRLLGYSYLKRFIKISKGLVPLVKVEIEKQIGACTEELDKLNQGRKFDKHHADDEFFYCKGLTKELRILLNWLNE